MVMWGRVVVAASLHMSEMFVGAVCLAQQSMHCVLVVVLMTHYLLKQYTRMLYECTSHRQLRLRF